jgi:hypothetical protein
MWQEVSRVTPGFLAWQLDWTHCFLLSREYRSRGMDGIKSQDICSDLVHTHKIARGNGNKAPRQETKGWLQKEGVASMRLFLSRV